jgi:hypothetical protein
MNVSSKSLELLARSTRKLKEKRRRLKVKVKKKGGNKTYWLYISFTVRVYGGQWGSLTTAVLYSKKNKTTIGPSLVTHEPRLSMFPLLQNLDSDDDEDPDYTPTANAGRFIHVYAGRQKQLNAVLRLRLFR